ncbi:hypothetical protein DSL64_22115 [Dyadobacter luteus]|uniref:Uncharacterized protein n=1 Tax=Dyadobacter luteus TaxID=2259619 RepID=A0A3D8Y7C7_9BACT|nr:hypothetical protein [Dyadobacter luteus]REA58106.1 hypothetical protein DSL64_22115 [Dyadobacter luteus]
MKKMKYLLLTIIMFVGVVTYGQTTPDFFAGKWEISVKDTPMGDMKFLTDLVRQDGKLTGELSVPADASAPKRPITRVEETADKLVLYFESAEVGEIAIDLAKVDQDNLKGTLYTFEANAKRVK